MKIRLNDNYRITSDPMNFVLEVRKVTGDKSKNPGVEHWEEVGYYPTLEALLNGMFKRHLKASECEGIQNIIDEIKKAVATIQLCICAVEKE